MPNQKKNDLLKGMTWLVICVAAWSTSGLFVHYVVNLGGFTPLTLAFWRDLVTGVLLMGWLGITKRDLLRVAKKDLPWLGLMGAFGIGFFHVLWNTSVVVNGVSIATILQYNSPIFVALAAAFFFREKFTLVKIVAILITLSGTVLVAGGSLAGLSSQELVKGSLTLPGVLLGVSSAAVHSTFTMLGKKLSGQYSPVVVLGFAFSFGALGLLPFQVGKALPVVGAPGVLLNFSALILITTILGFIAYIHALQYMEAGITAIGSTMEVPMAAVLAYFLLGERILPVQGFGALLVIAGVLLVSVQNRKASAVVIKELDAGL